MHKRVLENESSEEVKDQSEPLVMSMREQGTISAEELLDANPEPFHGTCMKKNNSYLAYFFPCWFPQWKQRFFVISGSYIFRFADRHSEGLKGVPIPLESCQFNEQEGSLFEINIIRKSYILDPGSTEKRAEWIRALKIRKLDAIREDMGHAPVTPAVRKTNTIAKKLFEKRIRLDSFLRHQEQMNPMNQMFIPQTMNQY